MVRTIITIRRIIFEHTAAIPNLTLEGERPICLFLEMSNVINLCRK